MLLVAMKVLNLDVSSTDTANTRTVLVQCKYGIVLDTKGLLFSSICIDIVLFSTHKGVMTPNDVREECLECHMTCNDVREECYIIVMLVGV